MARATRDHLMRTKDQRTQVDLADGSDVVIRGLSRAEILSVNDYGTLAEKDAAIVQMGLVDPAMTLEDVRAWQSEPGSMNDFEAIARAINEASGTDAPAGKTAAKRPPRRR